MLKWSPHIIPFCVVLFVSACVSPHEPVSVKAETEEQNVPETLVYECDGYAFTARVGDGEMALWLEEGYRVLPQRRSASGTRYAEGDLQFFGKGDEGLLTIAGRDYPNCKLVPNAGPWEEARRRGVSFRAVGNEPGWHLEIQPDKYLLYVGDYGMQRTSLPWVAPQQVSADVTRYRARTESSELMVEIEEKSCQDTMKGEVFPSTVTVTLNDTKYVGCGRHLDYPWQ